MTVVEAGTSVAGPPVARPSSSDMALPSGTRFGP